MTKAKRGIAFAFLAALLYALSAPLSKVLLNEIPPVLLAALLYLGAGAGMLLVWAVKKKAKGKEQPLTKKDLPYTVTMVALDIAAPILLLIGLSMTTAESTALLNNFEIVATAIIALCIFKEKISAKLWVAIGLITAASILLSVEDIANFKVTTGALFILGATVCWGFENNCTRKLSDKNPIQIVVIKGVFSGLGSLFIALILKQFPTQGWILLAGLGLGFVAYGLSIFFYVHAQRHLGAARTSAFYASAPFIGVVLSLAIFRELPHYTFYIALAIMAVGAVLAALPQDSGVKFGEYWARQFGKPTGFGGKIVTFIMNRMNGAMYRAVERQAPKSGVCSDIGFGNGVLLKRLLKRTDAEFCGVEISADMLRVATKRNKKAINKNRLTLAEGTADAIPFEREFDFIYTVNTVYFWQDLDAGLREIHTKLKNGGIFLNVIYTKKWLDKWSYTDYGFVFLQTRD